VPDWENESPTPWSDGLRQPTPGSLAHVTPGELSGAVIAAVREAVADGEFVVPVPEQVPIRTTPDGDYATPLPLRLAGGAAPEVGRLLARRLEQRQDIKKARVTGQGFLTITPYRIDTRQVSGVPKATWPTRPLTFDNPGFRVRFAYSRAAAAQKHAASLGITPQDGPLDDPRENRLTVLLADFPVRAEQAARQHDPRPLTRQLETIADAYHDVHEQCPALPKGDEPVTARHAARLNLARTVHTVLGNGLRMLGETPSDRL
jgi:arginyl-tRNA synthetase